MVAGMTTPEAPTPDSTDNAAPDVVIREIIRCASSWVPDARLVGNVRAGDIRRALEYAISRAEPAMTTPEAPTAFDEAIKKIGAPDESNGHWSLDEGNLRWFVSQCQQVQTPTPENVEEAIDQLLNDALCHRDGYGNHHENAKAIRAHIAAQQAEVERLRALLLPLKGRREAFADSTLGLDAHIAVEEALNPEQKGGV